MKMSRYRVAVLSAFFLTAANSAISSELGRADRIPRQVAVPGGFGISTVAYDMSGDGRYFAVSTRLPLVASDRNEREDVYRVDRITGEAIPASVDPSGALTGLGSSPRISEDGRFVVFVEAGSPPRVLRRDIQLGITELVSIRSGSPDVAVGASIVAVSATGRFVVFEGQGSQVFPGLPLSTKIFVRDMTTTTIRYQDNLNPLGSALAICREGVNVVFEAVTDLLVSPDTNRGRDIFTVNLDTGVFRLVSRRSDNRQISGDSFFRGMSADGSKILFASSAGQIVPGFTGGSLQAYIRNIDQETTVLASRTASGDLPGPGAGILDQLSISPDGTHIAFVTESSDFIPGDTISNPEVVVRNLETGLNRRVSQTFTGAPSSGIKSRPLVSNGGIIAGYISTDRLILPGKDLNSADAYARDLNQDKTTHITRMYTDNLVGGSTGNPKLSGDGRYTVFVSFANNLVPNDFNGVADVFVYDRVTDKVQRESVNTLGQELNRASFNPSISDDGTWIVFETTATNVTTTGLPGRIFMKNRLTGELISVDPAPFGRDIQASNSSISGNGEYVVFQSTWSFDGRSMLGTKVYRFSRVTREIDYVAGGNLFSGENRDAGRASISFDGQRVAFEVNGNTHYPLDNNGVTDVLVYDFNQRRYLPVSRDVGGILRGGRGPLQISADGMSVAFESLADLTPSSSPGIQVYVVNLLTGATFPSSGIDLSSSDIVRGLSRDGSILCYSALIREPNGNNVEHLVLQNTATGTTWIASAQGSTPANRSPQSGALSADGTTVAFQTQATNLSSDPVQHAVLYLRSSLPSKLTNVFFEVEVEAYPGVPQGVLSFFVFNPETGELRIGSKFGLAGAISLAREGTYDIYVKHSRALRKKVGTVDARGGSVQLPRQVLLTGDIDDDNEVTVFDYITLSSSFGLTNRDFRYIDRADLDGDFEITIFDYVILSNNFGLEGD